MADIVIQWQGDGLARIRYAMEQLASPRKNAGLARALNHTGDKVYTRVRKLISERTKVPVRKIDEYGALRKLKASASGAMEYQIRSTGKGIPLKVFDAYQTRRGVTVNVWSKGRYLIPHAFMVASLGGNVFFRTAGSSRLPIKKLTGPSIPKELVKKYVEAEFQAMVSRELPPRVEHELRVLTDGIVS